MGKGIPVMIRIELGAQAFQNEVLAPLRTSFVTLGELSHLSGPQLALAPESCFED